MKAEKSAKIAKLFFLQIRVTGEGIPLRNLQKIAKLIFLQIRVKGEGIPLRNLLRLTSSSSYKSG